MPRITLQTLTRKKTIANVMSEVEDADGNGAHSLKRCLSRWDIVAYGISTTVGAGLFVITGGKLPDSRSGLNLSANQ
eukprot:m.10691 g.10691  ORF g.10691 m.10691 type:complete len:77 (-) comp5652_c0_seq1:1764-1994(-)